MDNSFLISEIQLVKTLIDIATKITARIT